jgi:hypothetical protein
MLGLLLGLELVGVGSTVTSILFSENELLT